MLRVWPSRLLQLRLHPLISQKLKEGASLTHGKRLRVGTLGGGKTGGLEDETGGRGFELTGKRCVLSWLMLGVGVTLGKQLSALDSLGTCSVLAANRQGGHNQHLHSTDEVTESQREQVAFSVPTRVHKGWVYIHVHLGSFYSIMSFEINSKVTIGHKTSGSHFSLSLSGTHGKCWIWNLSWGWAGVWAQAIVSPLPGPLRILGSAHSSMRDDKGWRGGERGELAAGFES